MIDLTKKLNLIQGDCLETLKQLPDNKFRLTITSPPYNMQTTNSHGKVIDVGYSDSKTQEEYFDWLKQVISECIRVSEYTFFNIQTVSGNRKAVYRLIGEFNDNIKEVIIWKKNRYPPAINSNVLSHNFEYILIFTNKENSKLRAFKDIEFTRTGKQNTCWDGEINDLFYKEAFNIDEHHAIFPIWLPRRIIQWFSKKEDWILDPFMGCGTVGVVCKAENRNFVGIEIENKFFEISNKRLQQETLFSNSKVFA